MGIADRKSKQLAEREARIVSTARQIAEREGWNAVTVRRLADEIEYSQPVLYSHFDNRDAIVAAVALEGFRDIAAALTAAARGSSRPKTALKNVAVAYLDFARDNPALYEAMFVMPTDLRFADDASKAELQSAFEALAAVIAPFCDNTEDATECLWAALHGLAALEGSGRIRPTARDARIALVVRTITAAP